ncbi:MAG: XRE family transcriptional regulator [Defluviitaleaceae bacterium]|nr:XRE family transcriptional regulator [Defluviitaleaceae bacterium]
MQLGDKIKQLRLKMNLTQEELAVRCDLSKGFISQLERDKVSPSITTLVDILECLGSNLKDFFNRSENEKIVFGKDDIFEREDNSHGHIIEWLIPNAQKNEMEPILLKLAPGGRSEIYPPSVGEVFGYVLQGTVMLYLGKKPYKVKRGESFYYKPGEAHFVENTAKVWASILWVSSPPCF